MLLAQLLRVRFLPPVAQLRRATTAADTGVRTRIADSPRVGQTGLRTFLLTVLAPLAFLMLATAFFRFSDADIQISRLSYVSSSNPWPWAHTWLCDWIYDYGTWPGLAIGWGGLVVAVGSLLWKRLRPLGPAAFFLAAMLALGPGLLVNGILKPQWCRPRPCQIECFGGAQAFVGVWGMGTSERSKSFPSGHASMGFFLMAPAFLLYRRRPRLAAGFVALGLAGGLALGVTRILQGAHFASDVIWAGGMVYLTGLLLLGLFRLAQRPVTVERAPDTPEVRVMAESDAVSQQGQSSGEKTVSRPPPSRRNAA
jgi:membrane-associated PAP2 superfamily phosphatase